MSSSDSDSERTPSSSVYISENSQSSPSSSSRSLEIISSRDSPKQNPQKGIALRQGETSSTPHVDNLKIYPSKYQEWIRAGYEASTSSGCPLLTIPNKRMPLLLVSVVGPQCLGLTF